MDHDPQTCPDCGAAVSEAFQFCPACGIQLPAPPTPGIVRADGEDGVADAAGEVGASPTWRAERRLVSVMFVDMVGFTTMSEQLDLEDVREIQSRYFEVARSAVARYGGTLEKFIGDAVMAVWGSPVARENDAERAARAALEIVTAVGGMAGAVIHGVTLAARAAVTTGEAAVSLDAGGEGMVTGDLVNTASRLQASAAPGTVLVDGATRRAAGDALVIRPAGVKVLKGKATGVSAWEAVSAAPADGTDSVAGHRGPFVGRVAELASLRQSAESVIQERKTTLVSVHGVAGIGKSRLVRELERTMRDSPELRWYRGRPPRWGEETAFGPIADIVRRMLGVSSGEPAEVVRRTLELASHRLFADEHERAWIFARMGVLLNVPTEEQVEREELFAAWRRYLEAEAVASPLALVLEDLQWADTDSFDFIDYLTAWSHRHPILVVAIARPELLERRPSWGAGVPHFRSMHLDRLEDGQIDELLRALAPELPDDAVASVRRRAEGVPLYAVEIARMVTERQEETAARRYDIPESLHALLAARIDALADDERAVLLVASVLGRRFQQDALAALTGLGRVELGRRVGTLVRREFLAVDDDPSSPGRGQLAFVQDLMREVAYGTLSRRDRRRYHEAVIGQLSATDSPDAIEPIAEHLLAAHAAAGSHQPEAQAIAQRAMHALRQAAEHAEAHHAPHRALAHLERAISLTDDPVARAEIAEAAALAARAAARFGVAERHLRTATDLRDEIGDAVGSARDRAHLASVLLQAQRSDTALAELEAAWDSYSQAGGHDGAMGHLAAGLARAHMLRGDTAAATSWASRAIAAGDADRSPEGRRYAIDARISLGTALAQADRQDEGMAELQSAIELAASEGWSAIELRARTNLAWLKSSDAPREASAIARRGLDIAEQLGNREWFLQALNIAGTLALETGEWDWALVRLADLPTGDLPTSYRLDFAATRVMILSMRGEPEPLAALDALGEHEPDLDAHALGWVQLARAVAAVAAADVTGALDLTQKVAEQSIGFERAEALALTGRLAVWSARPELAASALAALEREPHWGRSATARLSTLRAAVTELEGSGVDAWTEPLATWRELELPLREALCLTDLWFLRGDDADRRTAIARLETLGAQALIELISQLVPTHRARSSR